MLTKDELRIIEAAQADGGILLSFRWHGEADRAVVEGMFRKGYLFDLPHIPNAYGICGYVMNWYRYAQRLMHPPDTTGE